MIGNNVDKIVRGLGKTVTRLEKLQEKQRKEMAKQADIVADAQVAREEANIECDRAGRVAAKIQDLVA